jgi:hypothetical protein
MLVPDSTSLAGQSRPHQWSYSNRDHVEDIVDRGIRGFHELLDDVCGLTWAGTVPPAGTVPKEQLPNTLVTMMCPALLSIGGQLVLPIYTNETYARTPDIFARNPRAELVSLTSTSLISDTSAFVFSIDVAVDDSRFAHVTGDLIVAIDPVEFGTHSVKARAETRVPWTAVVGTDEPIGVPAEWVGADRVFVWRPLPSEPPATT